MESDRRSSFLFGRIFFDKPASTSSENALGPILFIAAAGNPAHRNADQEGHHEIPKELHEQIIHGIFPCFNSHRIAFARLSLWRD